MIGRFGATSAYRLPLFGALQSRWRRRKVQRVSSGKKHAKVQPFLFPVGRKPVRRVVITTHKTLSRTVDNSGHDCECHGLAGIPCHLHCVVCSSLHSPRLFLPPSFPLPPVVCLASSAPPYMHACTYVRTYVHVCFACFVMCCCLAVPCYAVLWCYVASPCLALPYVTSPCCDWSGCLSFFMPDNVRMYVCMYVCVGSLVRCVVWSAAPPQPRRPETATHGRSSRLTHSPTHPLTHDSRLTSFKRALHPPHTPTTTTTLR